MSGPQEALTDRSVRIAAHWLAIGVVLFLAAFAWRFADERLYADSGYYLARVINEGSFRIEHGRWVLALSQVLPLLGVKLGIGLPGLILLHSLNNIVWLAGCMLFAWRALRDGAAVLALAMVHLVGLTHGLFCPIFELYYGVDLLILFMAAYRSERLRGALRWALLAMLFLGAISSHFFALLLVMGVLMVERIWRDRRAMLTLAGLMIAFLVLHLSNMSWYEQGNLEFLKDFGDVNKVLGLLAPARLGELGVYLAIHYTDTLIIACATAIFLWRHGKRWTALLFLAGLFGLHALASLYRPGFMHDRYREQVNFAITAWILCSCCLFALRTQRARPLLLGLLVGASLFRMMRAEWIAPWYTERTALLKAQLHTAHEHGMSKGIVKAPFYFGPPHHLIDLSWSTSVESLLLSAKEGPAATVSLITTEDLQLPEVRAQLDHFIFRRWDILDPTWLDTRYFSPPRGVYVVIPPSDAP